MKLKSKQQKDVFQPIKIEITVESLQELANLWHRANMSVSTISDNDRGSLNLPITSSGMMPFWEALDALVIKNGLKQK